MNKKLILIILLIFVISVSALALSSAFIIKESTSSTIITFGSIKMKLIETTLENGKEIEVLNNDNINISDNANVSRIVKVKNIGKHPIYVRLSLAINNSSQETNDFLNELIKLNVNEKNWIYKDGWYYYANKLLNDEATKPLLTEITFDVDKLTSLYPGKKFKLDIKAEAVQTENNSENILEVKGWPSN